MSASLRLDHVVVVVADRDRAAASFRRLGFTVTPGGAHSSGPTHNHIVHLADGRYLELFALRRRMVTRPLARAVSATAGLPALAQRLPAMTVRFCRHMTSGAGVADMALATDDLDATVVRARASGLSVSDPVEGRARDRDGSELVWRFCAPAAPDLPFLIEWAVRRTPSPAQWTHPNGVLGLRAVTVVVHDVDASAGRWAALLGRSLPRRVDGPASLDVGGVTVLLEAGGRDASGRRPARGGEGPRAVTLDAETGPRALGRPSDRR